MIVVHSCELENNPESQIEFIGVYASPERAIELLENEILRYYKDSAVTKIVIKTEDNHIVTYGDWGRYTNVLLDQLYSYEETELQ